MVSSIAFLLSSFSFACESPRRTHLVLPISVPYADTLTPFYVASKHTDMHSITNISISQWA
jgi:hypothetical protein